MMAKFISVFQTYMLDGLEWQQTVAHNTASGHHRIEIRWSLDHYSVRVYRRVQEPEWFRESHKAYWRHTAVATANRMMRKYQERA